MKEFEIAETIVTGQAGELPLSQVPDWKDLLGATLGDEAHATLVIAERRTLKPSGTQSIRIGSQDLTLPQHTISPESHTVDFEILSTLGKGGMGVVHLARQNALAREVAIKQLLPDMASPLARQNLLREACITGRLEHPNIVPIYSLGIDELERPLFVMKRIEGITWQAALRDPDLLPRAYRQFDDPLESHLEIFEHVCLAMHYAHSRDIIHRDLKPENVMLGEYGEVYVVDWGIAVSMEPDEQGLLPLASEARQVVGTPMYMAPEQAAADPDLLGPHTDVFALGAILHELVTGKPRHEGNSLQAVLLNAYQCAPAQYPARVPEALAEICNKACARDIKARHASPEALREAIAVYRTQRRASELLDATAHRLDELSALHDEARRHDEVSAERMVRAYALVGACRFGLEQALKIKPDESHIVHMRARMLNTMLGLELLHRNLAAAQVLCAELGQACDPKNAEQIELLVRELAEETARLAELEQLEYGMDLRVSRKSKGLFALALCVVWGSGSLLLNTFLGDAQSVDEIYFGATVYKLLVSAVILVLWLMARRAIRMTPINRKLLSCVPIILVFGLVARLVAWNLEIQLFEAIAMELLCYAIVGAMLAAMIDRWLLVTSVVYTAGICMTLLWLPGHASVIFGGCNLVALMSVSWRWFSGRGSLTQEMPTR